MEVMLLLIIGFLLNVIFVWFDKSWCGLESKRGFWGLVLFTLIPWAMVLIFIISIFYVIAGEIYSGSLRIREWYKNLK